MLLRLPFALLPSPATRKDWFILVQCVFHLFSFFSFVITPAFAPLAPRPGARCYLRFHPSVAFTCGRSTPTTPCTDAVSLMSGLLILVYDVSPYLHLWPLPRTRFPFLYFSHPFFGPPFLGASRRLHVHALAVSSSFPLAYCSPRCTVFTFSSFSLV